MKIVIVNGSGGCGKSTFEQMCTNINGERCTLICSTIDVIKEAARVMGWKGGKEQKDRKFLSDLKDLATEYNDCSYNYVLNKVNYFHDDLCDYGVEKQGIVFVDCREPQEIQKFVDRLGAITVLIRRPSVNSQDFSNHADAEVENFDYDYYIDNDGDLYDLRAKAEYFLDSILKVE